MQKCITCQMKNNTTILARELNSAVILTQKKIEIDLSVHLSSITREIKKERIETVCIKRQRDADPVRRFQRWLPWNTYWS